MKRQEKLEIMLADWASYNTRRKSPSETLIPRLSYIAPLEDIASVMQLLQDSF